MNEKPDQTHIERIIMEYIKEELQDDRDVDISSERVNRIMIYERPDGGLYARFQYRYNEDAEEPWNDTTAFVFFRGSLLIDSRGQVASRSLVMAQKEIRALGPLNFLARYARAHGDRRTARNALIKWEEGLRCGEMVEARFRVNGAYFEFFGEIAKINQKSFRVVLRNTGSVNSDFEGEEISVPRRLSSAFSDNNGVFPPGGDGDGGVGAIVSRSGP